MATKITGVITGDKNDACNTCSCGNLVLPTGPPGPAGKDGAAGPAGPAGPGGGGGVLIKNADYYSVAIPGTAGVPLGVPGGTWNDLYEWTFTPGAGEVYNMPGAGFRFEWTGSSCEFAPRDPDRDVIWRVYNETTGVEIYNTGNLTGPGQRIPYPIQKHRMVLAFYAPEEVYWGGRVEILGGDIEGDTCYNEVKMFSGDIHSGLDWDKLGLIGLGLLRKPYLDIPFHTGPQTFKIQYAMGLGTGLSVILSEFLAEFIPAPT